MTNSILESTFGQLAFVAGAIPYLREEGVPRRTDGLVEDMRPSAAVTELQEVGALPGGGVQLILARI